MVAVHDPNDEPFFREWNAARHLRRSRQRSATYQAALGLTRTLPVPAILVVGSKGKGTAVAAATSALVKTTSLSTQLWAGGTVGTITSPPLRHNRERVRINGRAISVSEYAELADLARDTLTRMPELDAGGVGYLPPSGMYTLTGIAYLLSRGVDFLVVEEGLGGLSDDVSLFDYPVVAATQIFDEHTDVLGGSVQAVAEDLLGVVSSATQSVVTHAEQPDEAWDVLGLGAGDPAGGGDPAVGGERPGARVETVLASTLTATNLEIGARAAAALTGRYVPVGEGELVLAARASVHEGPGGRLWMVDAAINATGVAHAVQRAVEELGAFDVLAGFPDVKDVDACMAELGRLVDADGLRVTLVGAGRDYLGYGELARYGEVLGEAAAFDEAAAGGRNVLVVGTMSFAGAALEYLDAPTDFWW